MAWPVARNGSLIRDVRFEPANVHLALPRKKLMIVVVTDAAEENSRRSGTTGSGENIWWPGCENEACKSCWSPTRDRARRDVGAARKIG